jgi:hypothetical protein
MYPAMPEEAEKLKKNSSARISAGAVDLDVHMESFRIRLGAALLATRSVFAKLPGFPAAVLNGRLGTLSA